MKFTYAEGATPIDGNSLADLIPDVTTQFELNEFEQANILQAIRWARRSRAAKRQILMPETICDIHRRMFNMVWRWAGHYRKGNLNLGCDWRAVAVEVKNLCDDTQTQIQFQSYPWDELAARFHHRLVAIHPFPNGNGRLSRLCTDVLLMANNQPVFSWGQSPLLANDAIRSLYIQALRKADAGDFSDLNVFVRS